MTAVVIDTNVLVVANNRSTPSPKPSCIRRSVEFLDQARTGIIVLDDKFRIMNEYNNNVNDSGQPGAGDAFIKWLYQNMWKEDRCEQVIINNNIDRGFEEFPNDPALKTFDHSDRKFVAVTLTSKNSPGIAVASDRGWQRHEDALNNNGIRIQFLCKNQPS